VQRTPDRKIDPSLRVGIAYEPSWVVGNELGMWAFAFDLDQPFDHTIAFSDKIHVGAVMGLLRFPLRTRIGVAQGYPCIGIEVDTSYMRLGYTFYGAKVGFYPGRSVRGAHLFRLKLKSAA
jgi:hypothetical protein